MGRRCRGRGGCNAKDLGGKKCIGSVNSETRSLGERKSDRREGTERRWMRVRRCVCVCSPKYREGGDEMCGNGMDVVRILGMLRIGELDKGGLARPA